MLIQCVFSHIWCFFFFKQKTAYEMRISDWSSDVCSSDLAPGCHADRADHDHHRTRRSVLRVSLAAPALLEHGAPELQRPLLRAIATCRDTWRQLFSEPSNGSDRTWPASPPTPGGGRWSEG